MKKLLPVFGTTASIIILVIVGTVFYGVAIEPRFMLDVKETEASMPGLSSGWEGATVVMLADQQTGMWWDNDGMVEETESYREFRRPFLLDQAARCWTA